MQALRISKTSFYKQCNAPRLAHPNTEPSLTLGRRDACIRYMLKRSDMHVKNTRALHSLWNHVINKTQRNYYLHLYLQRIMRIPNMYEHG